MKFTSTLIWLIGSIIGITWRVKVIAPQSIEPFNPNSPPRIYCFWHSTLLILAFVFRRTNKTAIVSSSKDGRMAADVAKKWGHSIIFGSSARGGMAALRQSIKTISEGRSIVITPDGPRGPREIVKQGAAQISLVSKTPLVTITVDAKGAWRLKSWDKFLIPYPFTKITITLSEPIEPADCAGDENSQDKLTEKIQKSFAL
ncbi:MAG: lysophospholipid acyltransferase family protein [Chitinispirillales bacterium]|jgi:lysophospholipid acyltransferase (LPLAT)-like uncharacterized protein|nr:lysophospholipid acyltransferase family protein [Chitinispirillales bacterium]